MKILLLSVNSLTIFYRQLVIPFGLSSIGSYVYDEGYTIKGIEMNSPPEKIVNRYLHIDEDLLEEIIQYNPDIIAMSTYAENIFNVFFWAEVIKRNIPNAKIMIGGNHVSYLPVEALEKCKAVDFVIRFEGEIPFKKLCKIINKKDNNYEDVPNLVYRKNGEIYENEQVDLIPDLDSLPVLNRDFFKSKNEDKSSIYHADVITARGCPFHCTFCDCNHYWKKKYRTAPIERVMYELKKLREQYPNLESIRIRDETVSVQKKRCLVLTENIIQHGINLEFQAHSRLDGLDEEVIKNLSLAGFKQLYIGLESGSQEILDRLQKGIKIENAYKVVPLLRKYGINFRFSLLLATPEETLEESIKTIQLINDLDLDFNEFYFGNGIIIYPGTAECDKFLKIHPGFKWLELQELYEGYQYVLDSNKNPIGIYCYKQDYTLEKLNETINKTLESKLKRYYETDYMHLRQMEYISRIRNHHFKGDDEFFTIINNFLQGLDNYNKPWSVLGNYTYYKNIMKDVIEEANFKNFNFFMPLFTKDIIKQKMFKKIKKLKYLVILLPENEINTIDNYLADLKFQGDVIFFDKFIVDDNLMNEFNNYNLDKIITSIKRSISINKITTEEILFKLKSIKAIRYIYNIKVIKYIYKRIVNIF